MIPYGHQSIDAQDIAAVVDVLQGDWLTQGPHVGQFEDALAEQVDARYAVAFSSGTAALHGAMAVSGLERGDIVAMSTLSFIASANCARYVGATPRLLDIDKTTLNFDPGSIGPQADGLVAVHFAGLPADLSRLASRPRVVIEDAAHALGAHTPDGPVGNCAHSDMCCFSFHPVKAITTGEGGAVTTNSPGLAAALRLFRSHMIDRESGLAPWEYEVAGLGFNYRLTDIQAALGTSQLKKLPRFIGRRNELAERYRAELGDVDLALPPTPGGGFSHAYHLFPVRVAERDSVFAGLVGAGIGAQVHYVPIHRHRVMVPFLDGARFPVADESYEGLLSLPLYPALSDIEQSFVIDTLRKLAS